MRDTKEFQEDARARQNQIMQLQMDKRELVNQLNEKTQGLQDSEFKLNLALQQSQRVGLVNNQTQELESKLSILNSQLLSIRQEKAQMEAQYVATITANKESLEAQLARNRSLELELVEAKKVMVAPDSEGNPQLSRQLDEMTLKYDDLETKHQEVIVVKEKEIEQLKKQLNEKRKSTDCVAAV
eukprot:TRINITY_DN6025_c0_g1_i1.p1 TRINITY_DN6025_c0_g1~~TRINITY_DN6025_c0_g1_i1.p1  ORF type:complete len:184 (+),score=30.95 TRINITY_DN6025_c0_g1_i1:133-684(+)